MKAALLLDVGNTTVAWRLTEASGAWAGPAERLAAEHSADRLVDIARQTGAEAAVAVSSSPMVISDIEAALMRAGVSVALAERDFAIPIETAYRDRREIGRDRLCDALAAAEMLGAPCVACSIGTCITVEAIDAAGVVLGGAIAAGLPSLRAGLEAAARHLGAALALAGAPPDTEAPGRSTADNLRLGVWLQLAAAVDRMVAMAQEAVGRDAPVVLTGGDAAAVVSLCHKDYRVEPFLTLEGLRIAYLKSSAGGR